jgi:hypothetical protein
MALFSAVIGSTLRQIGAIETGNQPFFIPDTHRSLRAT